MTMTSEQAHKILTTALRVAVDPPASPGKYSVRAGVRWSLIEQLRKEIEDAGIDWKKVKAQTDELKRQSQDEQDRIRREQRGLKLPPA